MIIHDKDSLFRFGTALAHVVAAKSCNQNGWNEQPFTELGHELRLDILLLNGQGEVVPEHGL
jgi:hypothetical protein